ncbi:MAG: hypothetical protein AABZ53_10420, partial [Planctomycetota bacterium]
MLILGIETSCDETAASVVLDGRRVLSSVVASQNDLHAEYGGVVPELASRAHLEALVPVVERAVLDAGVGLAEIDAIAVGHRPGLIGSLLVGVAAAKALAWGLGKPLIGVDHVHSHLYAGNLIASPEVSSPEGSASVAGGAAPGTATARDATPEGSADERRDDRGVHGGPLRGPENICGLPGAAPPAIDVQASGLQGKESEGRKLNAMAESARSHTNSADPPEPRFPALGLVVSGGHTSIYLLRSWVELERLGATIDDAM